MAEKCSECGKKTQKKCDHCGKPCCSDHGIRVYL